MSTATVMSFDLSSLLFWRRPSTETAIHMLQAASAMGDEMDKLSSNLESITAEAEAKEIDPLAVLVQRVKSAAWRNAPTGY